MIAQTESERAALIERLERLVEEATAAETDLDLETAERLWREGIRAMPDDPAIQAYVGSFLLSTGQLEEAELLFRRALNRAPRNPPWEPHMRFIIAQAQLAGGMDTRSAWEGLRWRFAASDLAHPELPGREWKGEPLRGRRLIIVKEQGFGDEIQCARFALALQARGERVVLTCSPELEPLFRSMGVETMAVEHDDDFAATSPDDRWVLLFDIPARAGFRLKNLPPAPYIPTPAATTPRGYSVGVVAEGNAVHWNDERRSLPAELACRLRQLPGAMSLHVRDTNAENFADTAAIIAGLDLVITVDTSVAHLAGAMGKPVWIMLPAFGVDWRWQRGREDSPWYPSARLYRQPKAGDWLSVIERIERDLAERTFTAFGAAA
ncbi:glycosyltransferase family 9 protein [Phenylobacterium sp.]|uniref:glycosyltransferase family 9 protein n=1 Tax=Phenylobacterium sp. TaxID=1871053 RepID=UPI00286E90A9|nr:glycosyltransferase family 9 protein [Phenylobacterium sp.]